MGTRLGPAASAALLLAGATAAILSPATAASAATSTFTPVADTYVQSDTTSANYGTATQIVVDNSPVRRLFLRFTVSGIGGPGTGAKLRLRTLSGNDGSPTGGTFRSRKLTQLITHPRLPDEAHKGIERKSPPTRRPTSSAAARGAPATTSPTPCTGTGGCRAPGTAG